MNIVTKQVRDLTPTEYRACYQANYGLGGYMRSELVDVRAGRREGFVIMLWHGPADTPKNMTAWALLVPVRIASDSDRVDVGGTNYTRRMSKYSVQFWVKATYRRQGHGTTLMNEVLKHDKRPHVFPHSEASGELFSAYDITASRSDRNWLVPKPKRNVA